MHFCPQSFAVRLLSGFSGGSLPPFFLTSRNPGHKNSAQLIRSERPDKNKKQQANKLTAFYK